MSNVRFAVAEDAARIAEILAHVGELHAKGRPDIFHGKMLYDPERKIRNHIEDEDDGVCFIVSTNEQDEITGALMCYFDEVPSDDELYVSSKVLWIESNGVDEQYRGKGYGKMLLDYVKAFAKEQECYRIKLSVWSFNEHAFEFYKSQGMEISSYSMEYKL